MRASSVLSQTTVAPVARRYRDAVAARGPGCLDASLFTRQVTLAISPVSFLMMSAYICTAPGTCCSQSCTSHALHNTTTSDSSIFMSDCTINFLTSSRVLGRLGHLGHLVRASSTSCFKSSSRAHLLHARIPNGRRLGDALLVPFSLFGRLLVEPLARWN